MQITVLDRDTLGEDLSLRPLEELGTLTVYGQTMPGEVAARIANAEVVVLNKVKLFKDNLYAAENLKLICVAATGFDNIDVAYCREKGIAVCNVEGYSSNSVAQVTASMVLSLATHLTAYTDYVRSGAYSESGTANRLTPVYNELYGKTWGIVGYGNIGKAVGKIAEALGCRLLVSKRTPEAGVNCVDIDTLIEESDVISVHTPLNDETRGLISRARLSKMKKNVILVNAARGAVMDEEAVAAAIENGEIGAFGTDVYSVEPFPKTHPFYKIRINPNVILTPHMAWGAFEARTRCLYEITENIRSFYAGGKKGRVDL